MKIADLPFGTVDWSGVEVTTHAGAAGEARWRTRQFGDVRVRMLEYSPGYVADHWCSKGHFLLCLDGELDTELADGRRFTLTPGHELPGGGRRRAASFCDAHRGEAVCHRLTRRRRLRNLHRSGAARHRRHACLSHALVLVAGNSLRHRRARGAQFAVFRPV